MGKLGEAEKRGRPDLVHQAVLSVTGTPLYLDGDLRLFVHTCSDLVLEIRERTRIPKNYFRFRGLAEQALSIMPEEGLVVVRREDISGLIRRIRPDLIAGFSIRGRPSEFEEIAVRLSQANNPSVLVGGFPHGHFSGKTLGILDFLARIDTRSLEAHVVSSRLVYEVEKLHPKTNH